MTPEEIDDKADDLYWSLSIDTDSAFIDSEKEIQMIAAAIREAVEKEREELATICETEASEITMTRISAAMGTEQHTQMRAEAQAYRAVALKIRARGRK